MDHEVYSIDNVRVDHDGVRYLVCWMEGDKSWEPEEHCDHCDEALEAFWGQGVVQEGTIRMFSYRVDFDTMQQTNLKTQTTRPIRRTADC
jgi:hypothetical protein